MDHIYFITFLVFLVALLGIIVRVVTDYIRVVRKDEVFLSKRLVEDKLKFKYIETFVRDGLRHSQDGNHFGYHRIRKLLPYTNFFYCSYCVHVFDEETMISLKESKEYRESVHSINKFCDRAQLLRLAAGA